MRRSAPLLAAALALWSGPARAADGVWSAIAPPNGRLAPSLVHDPIANCALLFGGYDGFRLDDTWALELDGAPSWHRVVPGGAPPSARYLHATVTDPVRGRLLVVGGDDGALRNDVWALSFGASRSWSEIAVAGPAPSPRASHAAAYDPLRDRIVVFGGNDGSLRNDVWALSLGGTPAWTQILPAGTPPSARERHTAVWDAGGDRLLVFGGHDGNLRADVWELSFGGSPVWSELTPGGPSPTPRRAAAAIVDPIGGRWILFGGFDGAHRDDVWQASLAGPFAWAELSPAAGPTGRSWHAVVRDASANRMIVFGGAEGSLQLPGDAWALALSGPPAWSDLAPNPGPPSGRMAHSAVVDEAGRRMIAFAGLGGTDDAWSLSLDDGTWTRLEPSGAAPSPRSDHAAVFDAARERMLVFGGDSTHELWELALDGPAAWTLLAPSGSAPPGRESHTLVCDPMRDRLILFGGHSGFSFLGDVWELALSPLP
ncbi:MAG: Kelch repeat-containing protein, partial [bacterium]